MLDYKIRVTRVDANHSGPIVASFLQGPPPLGVPLLDGGGVVAGEPLALSYLRGTGEGKRSLHRRLQGESSSVVYSAQNFGGGEGGGLFYGAAGYRYAVGVVSRKRGVLDLYEADGGGVVFGLHADASRGLTALLGDALGGGSGSALAGLDARAKRDALVDSFGSQKKKKMESARKANIVDANAIAAAQEVRGGAAAAAAAAAAAEGAAGSSGAGAASLEDTRRRLLPPFNLAATALGEAYPMETLLTPQVTGILKPLAKAILKAARSHRRLSSSSSSSALAAGGEGEENEEEEGGEGSSSSSASAAVATETGLTLAVEGLLPASFHACPHALRALLRLLSMLASSFVEKSEAVRRLQCLLYSAHLIALYQCGKSLKCRALPSASASASTLSLHPTLDDSLELTVLSLGRFYEARSNANLLLAKGEGLSLKATYHRTIECEKRLLFHISTLALRAENFTLHLLPLAEDMRISVTLLAKAFRDLGCACAKEKAGGGGTIATLSLPLKFPIPPKKIQK